MADLKFTFDPAKVKISDGEILADLAYPARPAADPRPRHSRQARRRGVRR